MNKRRFKKFFKYPKKLGYNLGDEYIDAIDSEEEKMSPVDFH
mgnify:CR=1 FL=1